VADVLQLQREHDSYILELRLLLVQRLQLEEEYERLLKYAHDTRFDNAMTPTQYCTDTSSDDESAQELCTVVILTFSWPVDC
jgi:hypothetical protein